MFFIIHLIYNFSLFCLNQVFKVHLYFFYLFLFKLAFRSKFLASKLIFQNRFLKKHPDI